MWPRQEKRGSWRALGIIKILGRDICRIPDALQPSQHTEKHSLKPFSLCCHILRCSYLPFLLGVFPGEVSDRQQWIYWRKNIRSAHVTNQHPKNLLEWGVSPAQWQNASLGFPLQTTLLQLPKVGVLEPYRKEHSISLFIWSSTW